MTKLCTMVHLFLNAVRVLFPRVVLSSSKQHIEVPVQYCVYTGYITAVNLVHAFIQYSHGEHL